MKMDIGKFGWFNKNCFKRKNKLEKASQKEDKENQRKRIKRFMEGRMIKFVE